MNDVTSAVFVVMGLSIVADIYFAWLFLRTPELREGPGQLIFVQNQAQILLDLHWLTLLWQDKEYTGCAVLGFVALTSFMLSCAYAAAICVAVSQRNWQMWRYHGVVAAVSLGICIPMAADQGLGNSVLQTCSLRDGHWTEFSLLVMLAVSGLVCLVAAISSIIRYRRSHKFTLNSLLVSFVYLAMWTPAAIAHALNYQSFNIPPHLAFNKVPSK